MVLSQGYLLYFGPSLEAEAWFRDQLGYQRNPATSSIDFILGEQAPFDFLRRGSIRYPVEARPRSAI